MIDMYGCGNLSSRWQRKKMKVWRSHHKNTSPAVVPHNEEPDCGCHEIDPCDPCAQQYVCPM